MTDTDDNTGLIVTPIGTAVTFTEALDAFATRFDVAEAVGFAYTPATAPWFRYTDQHWTIRGGHPIPEAAFEVRAFTEQAELRWWRTTGFDRGTGVLLSDGDTNSAVERLYRLDTVDRGLRLWGTAVASDGGWTNLAEARIGDVLWVPLPDATIGRAVSLRVVDYVSRDEHGNVAVAEQRLTGLRSESPTSESGQR